MKRLRFYLFILISVLIVQVAGCGKGPELKPGAINSVDSETGTSEQPASDSTLEDRFKDISRGPEEVEVELVIPQDKSATATIRLINHSDQSLMIGYSFLIYQELPSGKWGIPDWAAEMIVPALAFELAPGQSNDYSLEARYFESGKKYKAKWNYWLTGRDDDSVFYAESEVVIAP